MPLCAPINLNMQNNFDVGEGERELEREGERQREGEKEGEGERETYTERARERGRDTEGLEVTRLLGYQHLYKRSANRSRLMRSLFSN